MLVVGSASFLFDPMDDSSIVMDVAASLSELAYDGETMWLDSYCEGEWPTNYSQNTLKDGKTYKITTEGTFSGWTASSWLNESDPPAGAFEEAPMYPSLAGGDQTGRVGADAYWGFACPRESMDHPSYPAGWTMGISLDRGGSWDYSIRPINDVYNPMHKYEAEVAGKGDIIGFRIYDPYGQDDYGMLKIVITPDTDEDGLFDDWEKDGIDFDQDGNIDLDLPMLEADWQHRDIFVEADYMAGKAPDQDAINDVKAAFYNAQVSNPDGVRGINLHVQIDEEIPWKETITFLRLPIFTDFYDLKETHFGTEDERLNDDAIEAKKMVFRYCIFANKIWLDAKCPGIAEGVLCDDFILAFGAFNDGVGSREQQAAVFMHELGHALGLNHGGNVSVNFKPNYLSIMNYAFQYNVYVPTRPLDYSYGKCIILDESRLDEFKGIGQAKATVWRGANNTIYRDPTGTSIDWDDSGWIDSNSVTMNVNNFDGSSPPNEILTDFNDWENLVYKFRGTRLAVASATPDDYHIELTTDHIEQMEEEAANIVVVDSPTIEDSSTEIPIEVVVGVVAVVAIALVLAVVLFFRRKKK
jgi:hypothetical protein